MRRKVVALGLAATLSSAGLSCSTGCPDPKVANPATATWSSTPGPRTVIVVRWSPTPGDPLPDSYYAQVELLARTAGGAPVQSIKLTAPHELTIEAGDLDAYLKSSSHLDLDLRFPDQRASIQCSHPGMADSFIVPLGIDLDPKAHTASAKFGAMADIRGACSVAWQPGAGDTTGAVTVLLVVAGALARRAGRNRHRSASPGGGSGTRRSAPGADGTIVMQSSGVGQSANAIGTASGSVS
jgi:hypothetical protein